MMKAPLSLRMIHLSHENLSRFRQNTKRYTYMTQSGMFKHFKMTPLTKKSQG